MILGLLWLKLSALAIIWALTITGYYAHTATDVNLKNITITFGPLAVTQGIGLLWFIFFFWG
jgi:hypothetical protein